MDEELGTAKCMTVTSYGEEEGETYRVTLNPSNVSTVTANERLIRRQGVTLNKVYVKFVQEGGMELFVNTSDLKVLEEATGTYFVD